MRRLVFLLAVGAALAAPTSALAHPLGNFTINRFSRVQTAGHHVYVKYVLDLAEIPTFQAGRTDAKTYARWVERGAQLTVDGRRARLMPTASTLVHPRGAAGLRTTRVEVVLRGPRLDGATKVRYADTNYAGRIGWKEIVVGADAPSRSHELRAYPKDLVSSPLDETSVTARLSPSSAPPPTAGRAGSAPSHGSSGFGGLIGRRHLSVLVVLAALGAAIFWGAAHALSPGHGKAIVTAYLVGARGTPRHALLLGAIVTVTHTIGVFGLGIVTLALSQFVVPERMYPWLNLVAGLLVVGVGASVLYRRSRRRRHHHHHDHDGQLDRRSLLAVGISGGLLPCPSALVVLLAAISLHRIAFGLLLIVAFSLGLAATISGIGLAAVLAKRAFSRLPFDGRLLRLLPAASALVILAGGVAMTLRALPEVS
jgi:nickel/cobalt transporter (NicO) family protein